MERFCWQGSSSGFVHVEMSTNSNMGMKLKQSFLTVELTSESPGGLVKAQLLSPSSEFLIQYIRGGLCEFAFALIPR